MTDQKVLTIQDISCYGQCSLTVAHPIISACGIETVMLPAAILSTHTGGFKGYTFRDLTDDIPGIMAHWESEGLRFDCLYTGYLGSVRQIEYVKELRRRVITPQGQMIVDPAMADNGKLYYGFNEEFVKNMASLCGEADVILPNITEACFLTGSEMLPASQTEEQVAELLRKLAALGAKKIVLKGVGTREGEIGVAIHDSASGSTEMIFTPRLPQSYHGTGDCFAAAFTGAKMQGKSDAESARIAAEFVGESIRRTMGDEAHNYGVKFEKALPSLVRLLNN